MSLTQDLSVIGAISAFWLVAMIAGSWKAPRTRRHARLPGRPTPSAWGC
ncbi:hypothetical protein ACLRDC_12590 [Gluconacetobacter sacchari]|uniref:Uncharacterized protein n=1 Tax=Gluconacetobacter sacchari TaxID=92759 RepID=A0A7W4IAM6_9PROT|nr:hypothetical protein [Gluconacetobacter sacchari]MBB2159293.1 hypothetical protein [Gluconacetobacter sacchari]